VGAGDVPLKPAWSVALQAAFGTAPRLVDFHAAPEVARQAINAHVAAATEGEITELLAPGQIDQLTRLVLTNAVYLAASWLLPFDAKDTAPGWFQRADGTAGPVAMLHQQQRLGYACGSGWQALQLPYVGGRLAMLLLLPDGPARAHPEWALGAEQLASLAALVGTLAWRPVQLWLPRFAFDATLELSGPLQRLGMRQAFTPAADFQAIGDDPSEPFYLQLVIQRGVVSVDETGTVAAAATATGFATASARPEVPVELRFDRPFLFVIHDLATGYPLFLGRVADPPAA
jgi:serpin B